MASAVAAIASFFTVTVTVSASTMAAITTAVTVAKTVSTIAAIASTALALTAKPPSLGSADIPVTSQLAGQTGFIPVAFGRIGYGGQLVLREADDGAGTGRPGWNNKFYYSASVLSAGPIAGWESTWIEKRRVYLGGNPVRTGNTTGLTFATGAQGLEAGSHTYTDNGLGVAVTLGATNDTRTFSQLIGGGIRPHGHNAASGHMKGLAIRAYRGYLNKKMINMNAEPVGFDVFRGQLLYDPRKDSSGSWGGSGTHRFGDASTYEYSDNAALVALNYALGRTHDGKPWWGLNGKITDIDIPAFINAANICDANNWRIGGVISNQDSRLAVLANMLASAGSVMVQNGSQLSCYTNAPKPVAMTITGADVISLNLKTSATLKDRTNRVVGEYRSEAAWWETVESDPVSSATYLAEDNGQVRTETFSTPLTTDHKASKQLAAYFLINKRNQAFALDLEGFPRLLNAKVGKAVMVDIPQMGITARKMLVTGSNFSVADQKVTLSLQAENDNGHEWALTQVGVAPASPQLDTFDRTTPPPPGATAWAITATSLTNDAGQTTPAIVVEGESDNPYADQILFFVRKLGDAAWTPAGQIGGAELKHVITAVEAQGQYEVGVSYRTAGGYESSITALPPVTVGQAVASTVQPGGIDWTDNGSPTAPIVNVPPALDVDENGQLQPGLIGAPPGYTSLEAFNAAQIAFNEQLEQDQADAQETINDGLAAEAAARAQLKTALEAADQTITTSVTGVRNEVTAARGSSSTLAGRLTTIVNDLNGKVSATEIDALETEITDARGSFGSINSRLNSAETNINGKASAQSVSLLESRSRIAPNLIQDGDFNQPLGEVWYLEGGAGPTLHYDGQVGAFLHLNGGGEYVTSRVYPFSENHKASVSWDGEADQAGANVYLQALPSYALLARATRENGGNGWTFRKVSDGSTVAAPVGTTGMRAVIDPQGGSMNVTRIKVNFGETATAWSDELTTREVTNRITTVETANENGASRITQLEATSDDVMLTMNSNFNVYTNAAQTGFTTPDGWYAWGSRIDDSHRVDGYAGRYAWWSHNNLPGSSGDVGLSQAADSNPRLAGLSAGWYVLELELALDAGQIGGAGIYCYFQNNGSQGRIDCAVDPTVDGTVLGYGYATASARHSWRKLIKLDNAGSGNIVFHLMTEWDGFEATTRPKIIRFQRAGLRRATSQEVAAERADTNANTAMSRTTELVENGRGSANLLGNANLVTDIGWRLVSSGNNDATLDRPNSGINYPSRDWAPVGSNCLTTHVNAPVSGWYADWVSDDVTVEPGKTYEFGSRTANHRTISECYIGFTDGNTTDYQFATTTFDGNRYAGEGYSGGTSLTAAAYAQFWGKVTMPAWAKRAFLILRRGPTGSQYADSWSWFTQPIIAQCDPAQTKPSPWSAGSNAWTQRAQWRQETAIPGASTFIKAESIDANGKPTSSVAIGANQVAVYNQSAGVWSKALEVANGSTTLYGNLTVGAAIRIGAGSWPVALQSKAFQVADGGAINFGMSLGAIPAYDIPVGAGLLPLNSGETYNLTLTNLTASGATLSAKINTPGTPGGITLTNDVASGSGPARQMEKGSNPDAASGNYTVTVSGEHRGRFYDRNLEPGEWSGTVVIAIWARKSGAWVEVGTITAYGWGQGNGSSSGYKNYGEAFTVNQTIQMGSGVQAFGASIKSWGGNNGTGTNGNPSVDDLVSVSWSTPGTPAGTRSALASGATTTVVIRPQN